MKCLPFLLMYILGQVYCDDDPTTYIPRGIFLQPTSYQLEARFNKGLGIINGYLAQKGQFPYQVALGVFLPKTTYFCGAALLTPKTILTAAHCVQGAEDIKIFLGYVDIMDYEEAGTYTEFVDLTYVKTHPNYNPQNYYNDIAIIRMPSPVTLSQYIKTVKLPSQPVTVDNSTVWTMSGWGKIKDTASPITDKLRYYNISGQDYASCATFYKNKANYDLNTNQICSSGAGNVGPCRGDSGGPLVRINSDGTYLMVGINSIGVQSCEIGAPSAYTNVYNYKDWIKANSDYKD